MPPLEALPTPGEEVLRRGVQSLTSFTSSHPPGPAWGSARSTLYPSLYCRVAGELWFLLVTVHDRRVGRGAHLWFVGAYERERFLTTNKKSRRSQ